ncbi:cyclase family protein [Candidatus Peregrinibacteria bacterium]|nr:cyclase family protein [Candidatus Peregrinibacteria bacterium]
MSKPLTYLLASCLGLTACSADYGGDPPDTTAPPLAVTPSSNAHVLEVEANTLTLKADDIRHFKKEFSGSFKPVDRSVISVAQYVGQQQKALSLSSRAVKKLYLSLAFQFLCDPVPRPDPVTGWGSGDQAGNTNTQDKGTVCRAGILQSYMNHGKLYKLDHVMTNDSPMSAFADKPFLIEPKETFCLPYTRFCGHSEYISGEIGGQGTQLDFFGHVGLRPTPVSDPSETMFYNGFTAEEVYNGALSADAVNPVNGIGILLDARSYLGNGTPLTPDRVITKEEVEEMIVAHDLDWLGLQPGMTVFIYTGKAEGWTSDPYYYYAGPGIRVEVMTDLYIPNGIVYHGLDNPFSDQAILNPDGSIIANSGDDPEIGFPIHANALMNGVLQSQNLNLTEMAADHVYLFSIQLSAPRVAKAKGAMVSPQTYGEPWMNQSPTM